MLNSAPYGSFKSPISAEMVASKSVKFSGVQINNEKIYFSEMHPFEKGRYALLSSTISESPKEIVSKEFNIRTRVHEYGGVAFFVTDEFVFFVNDHDQNIYRISQGSPVKLTNNVACRYADICYDRTFNRIFAIKEDHSDEKDVKNSIVAISLDTQKEVLVIEGRDFYSNPIVSKDGKRFAYLTWSHPNMPWDGTYLMVHEIQEDGSLDAGKLIAGGMQESIFQPRWHKQDLYFISDKTGWWNLYRYRDGQVICLWEKNAEFGMPQWIFGFSTYDIIDEDHLICSFYEDGKQQMGLLTISENSFAKFDLPFDSFQFVHVENNIVVFIGASSTETSTVVAYNFKENKLHRIKKSSEYEINKKYISTGEFISCPSNGDTAYAFFYPPKNDDCQPPSNEIPPLIVKCHGGPTAFSDHSLNYQIQYWTSRGFAFVDVNYGGSTAFGRAYRERLRQNWGVVDVQDCVSVVRYLCDKQLVDPNRVIIRGGSAGGYTTLACLTFTNYFSAGASYYGVSDLETMISDTHKFESRYLDSLIGPYPQKREVYFDRSPIHHVDKLNCPVILLQGEEDKIVLPNQSEKMFLALKEKHIPTAYLLFKGEQHGFRKSEIIKQALEAEYDFYAKIFHIPITEDIPSIKIEGK